jgi:phenylacetate-CoA ligase
LRQALKAPFYRSAFAAAGIKIDRLRSPAEMGGFFLSSELLKSDPESLLCETPGLAVESSGTAGRVSRVYLNSAELDYHAGQSALAYALYGAVPGDRLLCTLDLSFGLGSLLVERGVRHTGLFAMVVGRVDPGEAYRRMLQYRFNIIVSDPFWLARLTEIAAEKGKPSGVKFLIGGGEGITDDSREAIQRFWQAPLYMTYASTEAATVLGFECPLRSGYHVNEFDFYVEIDGVADSGYGEVVFTTLHRRVMPLIRFRTGDVARWMPGSCDCGLPFRRISPLRGRTDEQVSCAWGNLYPDFFFPLFTKTSGLTSDWQVALYERDLKPVFQFRAELAEESADPKAEAASFMRELELIHPDAWRAYRQALVEIEFCFFAAGKLRKGRKLLRLVDERHGGPPPWMNETRAILRFPRPIV